MNELHFGCDFEAWQILNQNETELFFPFPYGNMWKYGRKFFCLKNVSYVVALICIDRHRSALMHPLCSNSELFSPNMHVLIALGCV